MKKIINNKRYDTEKAKKVAEYDGGGARSDFNYFHEDLFKKRTGEFFLYGWGNAASPYREEVALNSWRGGEKIVPLTIDQAKEWTERTQDGDKYELIFGVVDEDDEKAVTTISLPQATFKKLKEMAADHKMSMSAVIEGLVDTEYDKEGEIRMRKTMYCLVETEGADEWVTWYETEKEAREAAEYSIDHKDKYTLKKTEMYIGKRTGEFVKTEHGWDVPDGTEDAGDVDDVVWENK